MRYLEQLPLINVQGDLGPVYHFIEGEDVPGGGGGRRWGIGGKGEEEGKGEGRSECQEGRLHEYSENNLCQTKPRGIPSTGTKFSIKLNTNLRLINVGTPVLRTTCRSGALKSYFCHVGWGLKEVHILIEFFIPG